MFAKKLKKIDDGSVDYTKHVKEIIKRKSDNADVIGCPADLMNADTLKLLTKSWRSVKGVCDILSDIDKEREDVFFEGLEKKCPIIKSDDLPDRFSNAIEEMNLNSKKSSSDEIEEINLDSNGSAIDQYHLDCVDEGIIWILNEQKNVTTKYIKSILRDMQEDRAMRLCCDHRQIVREAIDKGGRKYYEIYKNNKERVDDYFYSEYKINVNKYPLSIEFFKKILHNRYHAKYIDANKFIKDLCDYLLLIESSRLVGEIQLMYTDVGPIDESEESTKRRKKYSFYEWLRLKWFNFSTHIKVKCNVYFKRWFSGEERLKAKKVTKAKLWKDIES